MTAADLRAQAARRTHDAIAEAHHQLANGWTALETLTVLADAETIILDLLDQADAADELAAIRPLLWESACRQASSMHHSLRCFREHGHTGGHLYTIDTSRWAA